MSKLVLIAVALAGLVDFGGVARAESLDEVIRAELASKLTADLGVSEVHLSPALAALDVSGADLAIELPTDIHIGRQSVRVTLRGKHPRTEWVPVSFARMIDVAVAQRPIVAGTEIGADDVATERRAVGAMVPAPADLVIGTTANHDVVAGDVIGTRDVTLPAPLARGSQVAIDMWHGGVHIRGMATLELAARIGQPATARIGTTNTIVRGTLVAPATLVIGDAP